MGTSYVSDDDLEQLGLPKETLGGLSIEDRSAALSAASDLASGYLASQYDLPLVTWGDDLRGKVVDLASWRIMKRRGFNPEAPGDIAIRQGYEDAIDWLEKVAAGKINPEIEDSSSSGVKPAPKVNSAASRGW